MSGHLKLCVMMTLEPWGYSNIRSFVMAVVASCKFRTRSYDSTWESVSFTTRLVQRTVFPGYLIFTRILPRSSERLFGALVLIHSHLVIRLVASWLSSLFICLLTWPNSHSVLWTSISFLVLPCTCAELWNTMD